MIPVIRPCSQTLDDVLAPTRFCVNCASSPAFISVAGFHRFCVGLLSRLSRQAAVLHALINMIALHAILLLLPAVSAMGDGASDTMGPAAFWWPPDRTWSAETDNTGPCGSVANVGDRTEFPLSKPLSILLTSDYIPTTKPMLTPVPSGWTACLHSPR
jgi:hypothetical protein